jgi:hypothetical protein
MRLRDYNPDNKIPKSLDGWHTLLAHIIPKMEFVVF